MEDNHPSIVEYYSQQEKGHCGYCTSNIGSHTYGLHAHILKVEDYQNMIDRGWRRSGKYCYKAIMKKSCCPLYTIKCAATNFKVSKTQKKVIKKFNNFLATGNIVKDKMSNKIDVAQFLDVNTYNLKEDVKEVLNDDLRMSLSSSSIPTLIEQNNIPTNNFQKEEDKKPVENVEVKNKLPIVKSSKNKCLKAKYIRIERKKEKLKKAGFNEDEIAKKLVEKKKYPVIKKLEDHLSQPVSKNKMHNLRIALVRSCPRSEEFNNTFEVAFDLYKRYQMFVHKDTLDKLTERQYERFLVISPLQASGIYGSYHQQYWLDDKLIAVGVIDILPKCVSSVYFFYDPDYAHLSLGTYGALREVEFTRNLASRYPDLQFYYMGFYIHSCIKMKYKAAFSPSFLLCPEVYTWHPIKDCLPKLNSVKYSRFNDNLTAEDENSKVVSSQVLILYKRTIMPLEYYIQQKKGDPEEIEEIMEYAMLVGRKCSSSILLFRI